MRHEVPSLLPRRTETRVLGLSASSISQAIYILGAMSHAADLLPRSVPPPVDWRLHPEVEDPLWFSRAQRDIFA